MWADSDDILAMLGEAITKLRGDNPDPLDVANDLALVHAAVSARRDRASSDRSPVSAATARSRDGGTVHLTLIRGEG